VAIIGVPLSLCGLGSRLLLASGLLFVWQWRVDMVQGEPGGPLIDLGGGLGVAVTDHAVLAVGVGGRLAERARALVDGAAGVDEPVGGGALVSCPGDALGPRHRAQATRWQGPMKETAQAARYSEAAGRRPGTISQVGIPSRRSCLTGGA